MDTLGVQPLIDVLDSDYTGWPMTLDAWEGNDTAVLHGIGNLFAKGATEHLVTVYVLPDDFNTDETIIYVSIVWSSIYGVMLPAICAFHSTFSASSTFFRLIHQQLKRIKMAIFQLPSKV